MSEKLKPCPKCRGEATMYRAKSGNPATCGMGGWTADCVQGCEGAPYVTRFTRDDAAKAWNDLADKATPVAPAMPSPPSASAEPDLIADIKRLIRLADDVGYSRQSNRYARNEDAVSAIVELEASVFSRVAALSAAPVAPSGAQEIQGCPNLSFDTLPPDLMRRNVRSQRQARCQHDYLTSPSFGGALCSKCGMVEPAPTPAAAGPVQDARTPSDMPTLPQHLLDVIGEYGHARSDNVGDMEILHRWGTLIAAIKNYAWSCLAAKAEAPPHHLNEAVEMVAQEGASPAAQEVTSACARDCCGQCPECRNWYARARVPTSTATAAPDQPTPHEMAIAQAVRQACVNSYSPDQSAHDWSDAMGDIDLAGVIRSIGIAAQGAQAEPSAWQPITKPGQVKVGDKLRFTIGDEKYNETAKLILNAGEFDEEIIYNKRKNYYLITAMATKNAGSSKNCEFLRIAGRPTNSGGK